MFSKEQLAKSLKVSPEFKDKLISFIANQAKTNPSFAQHLDLFLKHGGTFVASLKIHTDHLASANRPNKQISIYTKLLEDMSASSLANNILKMVLNHEVTHAFDFIQFDNGQGLEAAKRLLHYGKVANTLSNVLHGIFQTGKINTRALDALSLVLDNSKGQLVTYSTGDGSKIVKGFTYKQIANLSLNCTGVFADFSKSGDSIITMSKRYIVDYWFLDDHWLVEQTFNLHEVLMLTSETELSRMCSADMRERMISVVHKHMNYEHVALWSHLTKGQQNTLNLLIHIYYRIYGHIGKRGACGALFNSCVIKLDIDCIETYLECIKPDTDTYFISLMEIHAMLNEQISPERLSNRALTNVYYNNERQPSVHAINEYTDKAALPNYGISFIISFCEVLTEEILIQSSLSNWKRAILRGILFTGLLSMLGFSITEVVLIKAIEYVITFSQKYLGIDSIVLLGVRIDLSISNATMVYLGLSGQSVMSTIKSISGSVAGTLCAKGIFFGLTKAFSKKVSPEIQDLLFVYRSNDLGVAFRRAAYKGNLQHMDALLPYIDINGSGASGRTALHQACIEGHENVVAWLKTHNANEELKDDHNKTSSEYRYLPQRTHNLA